MYQIRVAHCVILLVLRFLILKIAVTVSDLSFVQMDGWMDQSMDRSIDGWLERKKIWGQDRIPRVLKWC